MPQTVYSDKSGTAMLVSIQIHDHSYLFFQAVTWNAAAFSFTFNALLLMTMFDRLHSFTNNR